MKRQAVKAATQPPAESRSASPPPPDDPVQAAVIARSRDEVEERYRAAREAWTAAMHVASSGRSADLASLAIAQEAYEAAAADREALAADRRVAIPVEPVRNPHDIEVAVGQELAWRKVLHPDDQPRGLLSRIFRRRHR